jgi:hypothetical protein
MWLRWCCPSNWDFLHQFFRWNVFLSNRVKRLTLFIVFLTNFISLWYPTIFKKKEKKVSSFFDLIRMLTGLLFIGRISSVDRICDWFSFFRGVYRVHVTSLYILRCAHDGQTSRASSNGLIFVNSVVPSVDWNSMKLVRGKGDDNRDSNKLTCLFHLHLKTGSKCNSRENNELIFVFVFVFF